MPISGRYREWRIVLPESPWRLRAECLKANMLFVWRSAQSSSPGYVHLSPRWVSVAIPVECWEDQNAGIASLQGNSAIGLKRKGKLQRNSKTGPVKAAVSLLARARRLSAIVQSGISAAQPVGAAFCPRGRMGRLRAICVAGALSLIAQNAAAVRFDQLYVETVRKNSSIAPAGVDSFGDRIDLGSGGVAFQWTDIDIAGNNSLPVRLQRELPIADRVNTGGGLGGFGGFSDLDVPYIKGTYGDGQWRVSGTSPEARCTNAANGRPSFANGNLKGSDYWSGDWLHIPWAGTEALLTRLDSRLPRPVGTVAMTKSLWAIRCLTSTKNGYGGEAFLAVSPQGEKFYFDWVVVGPLRSLSKRFGNYAHSTAMMQRADVYFLPTRIEDRFGNWVTYSYSGNKLTAITASDGRYIQLVWTGSNVTSASSSIGAWTYSYPSGGITVTRPDSSKWSIATSGSLRIDPMESLPLYDGSLLRCPMPEIGQGSFGMSVTQPSGATANYTFEVKRHYENNIPEMCYSFIDESLMSYRFLEMPNFSDTFTLIRKEVAGPGLSTMTWSYSYVTGGPFAFEELCSDPPSSFACPPTKHTVVRGPKQSYQQYVFGNLYGIDSGQLLEEHEGTDTGTPSAPVVTILKSTTYSRISNSEATAQVFPDKIGSPGLWRLDSIKTAALRPIVMKETIQDGVTFRWSMPTGCNSNPGYCFDVMARPVKQDSSSGW